MTNETGTVPGVEELMKLADAYKREARRRVTYEEPARQDPRQELVTLKARSALFAAVTANHAAAVHAPKLAAAAVFRDRDGAYCICWLCDGPPTIERVDFKHDPGCPVAAYEQAMEGRAGMSEPVYLVITKRMDDGFFLTEGLTEGITDAEVLELAAEDWYAVAEMGTKQIIRGDPESRLAAATEALRLADVVVEAVTDFLQAWRSPMWEVGSGELELAIVEDVDHSLAAYRESRKETTDGN